MRSMYALAFAIAAVTVLVGGRDSNATTANPGGPVARGALSAPGARTTKRRSHVLVPGTCATNNSLGAFVAIPGQSDVAGGNTSGVIGGTQNEACDTDDVVAGGTQNVIGPRATSMGPGNSGYSFIGGGIANGVAGADAFVGAGSHNSADSEWSFVGAGEYNDAAGAGAFVGGGDTIYTNANSGSPAADGNVAAGVDSFVGAGDGNSVTGQGSFIGAGGSFYAPEGTLGNRVAGIDSFIGAGDRNTVGVGGNFDFIGAGDGNSINAPATSAAIVGGRGNSVNAEYAFIGGGDVNTIGKPVASTGGAYSTIAGGFENGIGAGFSGGTILPGSLLYSTIGGGIENFIGGGQFATIAGGAQNTASATGATVGGGTLNVATGEFATVPGGYHNIASGIASFAAGFYAEAVTDGSFVWSDHTSPVHLKSTAPNQFLARATGGVYFFTNQGLSSGVYLAPGSGTWSSLSDRAMKTDVRPLDEAAVLAKVDTLPVSEWSYISERGVRHVGPMAQDFYAAFKIGEDDRHIATIDEDGIALAAAKALSRRNTAVQRENDALRARLRAVELRVRRMAVEISALQRR